MIRLVLWLFWTVIGWFALIGSVGWILANGLAWKIGQALGRGKSSAPPYAEGSV